MTLVIDDPKTLERLSNLLAPYYRSRFDMGSPDALQPSSYTPADERYLEWASEDSRVTGFHVHLMGYGAVAMFGEELTPEQSFEYYRWLHGRMLWDGEKDAPRSPSFNRGMAYTEMVADGRVGEGRAAPGTAHGLPTYTDGSRGNGRGRQVTATALPGHNADRIHLGVALPPNATEVPTGLRAVLVLSIARLSALHNLDLSKDMTRSADSTEPKVLDDEAHIHGATASGRQDPSPAVLDILPGVRNAAIWLIGQARTLDDAAWEQFANGEVQQLLQLPEAPGPWDRSAHPELDAKLLENGTPDAAARLARQQTIDARTASRAEAAGEVTL